MTLGCWLALGWAGTLRAEAGPLTVGPAGEPPPPVDGTAVTVAPGPSGTVVGVTVRAAADVPDMAVLWPMPGIRTGTASDVDPRAFEQVEATTRPRVEGLGCDDLVQTTHWRSVPGCTSYDFVPPPPDRGADAVGSVGLGGEIAPVDTLLELIAPEELQDWLDRRGFAIDPAAAAALEPHLLAGEPILTIQPLDGIPAGAWLPPVRFVVDLGDPAALVLPLGAGEPLAAGRQALTVLVGVGADQPNPEIANYPREYVPDGCMLRRGQSAAAWLGEAREAFEAEITLPAWVLVHAGPAGVCSPCTADPLDAAILAEVGVPVPPAEARLSRLWLEWDPGELDQDPVVALTGPSGDADLRFVAHDPQLGAYFPLCGEAGPRPGAGSCPNLAQPGGCRTAGGSLAGGLLGIAVAASLWRRRLAGLLLLGLLASAAPARAAPRSDGGPPTEIGAALALIGTDRLVPAGLEHGAPWLLNPYLGIEGRRNLVGWRRGRSVGVTGQLRGLAGRAAPWGAKGAVGFVLLEPAVGIEARHGRFRESSPCPFGRYGGSVVLSTLWPSVSRPRAVPSGELHAGFGWWLGRGPERTGIELRLSVVPRTDAWDTSFHPNVGLPGWRFFPGTANLWVVASRASYLWGQQ